MSEQKGQNDPLVENFAFYQKQKYLKQGLIMKWGWRAVYITWGLAFLVVFSIIFLMFCGKLEVEVHYWQVSVPILSAMTVYVLSAPILLIRGAVNAKDEMKDDFLQMTQYPEAPTVEVADQEQV